MRIIYTFSILIYQFAIKLVAPFNKKAKLWSVGRATIFEDLEKNVPKDKKVIWFHCASLGEFEQGRSVIEAYKKAYSDDFILLSFFSPSGYEIRKNYIHADYVCYLPADTSNNANRFIKTVNPSLAFFVKYEFWFNYLNELKKSNTSTFLVSGIFRPQQHFFKWYGGWFRKQLSSFEHFFIQNQTSLDLLQSINYHNYTLTGDTRFDRVIDVVKSSKPLHDISAFVNDQPTIVAGSTWLEDEKVIAPYVQQHTIKLIIAPHEVNPSRIKSLQHIFGSDATLYSTMDVSKNILIIDTIGLLSSLYAYGSWAYIGGGFGTGIHNTLEAASYGIPVVFGPNFDKFQEAKDLIDIEAARSISNAKEFQITADTLFKNNTDRIQKGKKAKEYVFSQGGATQKILDYLSKKDA